MDIPNKKEIDEKIEYNEPRFTGIADERPLEEVSEEIYYSDNEELSGFDLPPAPEIHQESSRFIGTTSYSQKIFFYPIWKWIEKSLIFPLEKSKVKILAIT